ETSATSRSLRRHNSRRPYPPSARRASRGGAASPSVVGRRQRAAMSRRTASRESLKRRTASRPGREANSSRSPWASRSPHSARQALAGGADFSRDVSDMGESPRPITQRELLPSMKSGASRTFLASSDEDLARRRSERARIGAEA